jgi:RimJ/RimL family protein N-acetyltransferase
MEQLPHLLSQRATQSAQHWRKSWEDSAKLSRRNAYKPRFDYQNLPDSERLSYDLFSWNNYHQMLDLFQHDPNPFIGQQFKHLDTLEDYAVSQLEYNRYSFKRGACDWFLQRKKTQDLIGVLHIYDLNWDLYDGKHPACTVGYAISEKHRQQGFAFEAMTHLLTQIPLIFKRYEVHAHLKTANSMSRKLLEKLGFMETDEHFADESWWYKQLIDVIPLKTDDEVWAEEQKYR